MSAITAERVAVSAGQEATAGRRPRRWSAKRAALVLALLAGVGAGGVYGHRWWTDGRFIETTDDAYVGGDVTVLASHVAGFVTELAVSDNQAVRAGDLLLRIDDRPFRAEVARAEAAVAGGVATLDNLDANRRLAEAELAGAEADLDSAEAETARSRFDFDRYRALSSVQYASQQRFQQAEADYKKAQAAVLKARASSDAVRRRLDVIATEKSQATAALAGARAALDIARLDLGYTEVRAPIDGVVGNRSARTGTYATVGASLISLVPAQGLWVDANFKENQLAALKPGESATIEADVLPGVVFRGHVESLAPATGAQFAVLPPENATGNFTKIVQRVPVRIRLDGDGALLGRLRPGLSVTAAVDERTGSTTALAAADRP